VGVTLITTNWDEVVDRRMLALCGAARVEPLSIFHLHGRLSDPASLYLPTEIRSESYRDLDQALQLEAQYEAAMRQLERAHRLVVYGLSLSPLDIELAIAVGEGCRRAPLREIYVIDHDFRAVAERLWITIRREDVPPIRCFSPDDLSRAWQFPEPRDASPALVRGAELEV
jgi:hypothetical protein